MPDSPPCPDFPPCNERQSACLEVLAEAGDRGLGKADIRKLVADRLMVSGADRKWTYPGNEMNGWEDYIDADLKELRNRIKIEYARHPLSGATMNSRHAITDHGLESMAGPSGRMKRLTLDQLSEAFSRMRAQGPKSAMAHLFGIVYASQLNDNSLIEAIVAKAGASPSLKTEVAKGKALARYVTISQKGDDLLTRITQG